CAAIGALTPMLVDRWSRGDPRRAGGVYAMNIIGCVIGPLLASFVLLPWVGERVSLIALGAPLAAVAAVLAASARPAFAPRAALGAACAIAALLALTTRDFETLYPRREVRRDYAATVIAAKASDDDFDLLVNGIGMTR